MSVGIEKLGDRAPTSADPDELLSFGRLATPVIQHLTAVVALSLFVAASVLAYTLIRPKKYEAPLSFSTVQGSRAAALGGSLPAALLAATAGTGLQATPALLSRLATSENVRVSVARTVVPGRGDSTVADVLAGENTRTVADPMVAKDIGKILATASDRETGLVTVSATARDSALARFITERVVAEVTIVFQRAAKAQASETRASLSQRFDTATMRLRNAERTMQEFSAQNRTVATYSQTSLERDRLNRELTLAQTLYNQVETEREAAKQKELEDTPAVVIVDPLPRELVPVSRQVALKTVAGFLATFVLVAVFFIVVDLWRPPEDASLNSRERVLRALHENRWLRWTVAHRLSHLRG